MRPWHFAVVIVAVLVAMAIVGQIRGFHRTALVARKILATLCLITAVGLGALGSLYVISDMKAYVSIRSGRVTYAEGPGLGLAIGAGILVCVTLPSSLLGIFLLKYRPKSSSNGR